MTQAEHFHAAQLILAVRKAVKHKRNAIKDTILLSHDDSRLLATYRNGGRRYLGAFGKFRFEGREVRLSKDLHDGEIRFE